MASHDIKAAKKHVLTVRIPRFSLCCEFFIVSSSEIEREW